MSDLRELQHEFLNHLLAKPSTAVHSIESAGGVSAQDRLDLYADGYKLRLKEAIGTDYEQLHAWLGDDIFDDLMERYIALYPSHHPSLRYYSKHMLELLGTEKPWTDAPELVEIASIEKAFCDSFDSADIEILGAKKLTEIDPDYWPEMKLEFHPSVQVLELGYNSFQIWQALSEGETPPPSIKDPGHWLIWRSHLISSFSAISDAENSAITVMMQGGTFSDLCDCLFEYYDEESTPLQAVSLLQEWLTNDMVISLG